MACTYDITTDRGKVRLLISDTSTTSCHFADTEVDAFLTMADDSVNLAAAMALESWAASLSETADSEKIGDYSYTKKQVSNMMALSARLRENESQTPAFDWAEMDLGDGSGITAEED
jgi:late competence protein required for DNA uptake (superfamily II DNA/RNA helicase)